MEQYLKCACGNIVRVVGEVKKIKCPRCEIGLCWAETVRKSEWLGAHDIRIFREHIGIPYLNNIKSSGGTTLCEE